VFPLWMGAAPALLRAFLEQLARGYFFVEIDNTGWRRMLKGKSVRIIVTMGMPAPIYRLAFGAHGVRGIMASVLGFAGAGPQRVTMFGMVEAGGERAHAARLAKVKALGRRGQ
jgi:putative NADPH-quinone reductase